MRRTFFFIVAVCLATSSFASVPRASMPDRSSEHASAFVEPLSETRVWASDVLAPFERPAETELTRALRQGYGDSSTTNASGLGRFLSVDPGKDWDIRQPQSWNMYSYVRNDPINRIDPTGRCGEVASLIGPRQPCKPGGAVAGSVGTQLTNDGIVRRQYVRAASTLDQSAPNASLSREVLKMSARGRSSGAGAVVAETMSPLGSKLNSAGRVNATNKAVNGVMSGAEKAGPVLMVVGLGISVYNVAQASPEQRARVAAGEAGGWAGALVFAEAGGAIGSSVGAAVGAEFGGVGAVPGAAIGGAAGMVGGSILGAEVGTQLGYDIYDAANSPPDR
jgi:hypothetical protein